MIKMSNKNKGQTVLVAVMILSSMMIALGIAIATFSSNLAIGTNQLLNAAKANNLAFICLEDALMKFSRMDLNFSNFTTGDGQCTIEVSGNNPMVLIINGQTNQVTRKLEATVIISNDKIEVQKISPSY